MTVSVVSWMGGAVGRRLRKVLRWRPARRLDSAAGATFSLFAWAIVVWVTATVLVATHDQKLMAQSRAHVLLLDRGKLRAA